MADQSIQEFELCRTEAAMVTVVVSALPGVSPDEVHEAMARATEDAYAAVH